MLVLANRDGQSTGSGSSTENGTVAVMYDYESSSKDALRWWHGCDAAAGKRSGRISIGSSMNISK